MTNPTGTQAVDRAAGLLREIVDSREPLTFSELTAATGLAKSTTSRLLFALERHELVRRERDGGYLAGDVFVRYAGKLGRETDLIAVARPYLRKLGERTGETINLGVARNGLVEQIAQVDSRHVLGGSNWVGRAVPLHATAQGKVLLALGAAELPSGRLLRLTPSTITSRHALGGELVEVGRRGFAVTVEELETDLIAIAAPVRCHDGSVVAALAVSAPTSRVDLARIAEYSLACVEEGRELSLALGHRPAQPSREGVA